MSKTSASVPGLGRKSWYERCKTARVERKRTKMLAELDGREEREDNLIVRDCLKRFQAQYGNGYSHVGSEKHVDQAPSVRVAELLSIIGLKAYAESANGGRYHTIATQKDYYQWLQTVDANVLKKYKL